MIERYKHHGANVAVNSELKGKHSEHCLCHEPCPDFPENGTPIELAEVLQRNLQKMAENITTLDDRICPQAAILYALCREFDMVTPVYECKSCSLGKE